MTSMPKRKDMADVPARHGPKFGSWGAGLAVRELLFKYPIVSFSEIGRRTGISRERVRQIANRFSVSFKDRSRERRRLALDAKRKAIEASIKWVLEAWTKYGKCGGKRSAYVINLYLAKKGKFRCGRCNVEKPIKDATITNSRRRGTRCKSCTAEIVAAYRLRKLGRPKGS